MKRLSFIPLLLLINGCYIFLPTVTLDDTNRNLAQVNYSDGIDKHEAIIIAQHYLLTTADEPCKSALSKLDIGDPYTCGGWSEGEKKYGKHVCFDWKSWNIFTDPMFIKVSTQTGEAKCSGPHVLKM